MKSYRISEIIYWVISLIATYEAYDLWQLNRSKAYLFIGFAVLSVFMALFRRHFRKKFEQRAQSKK